MYIHPRSMLSRRCHHSIRRPEGGFLVTGGRYTWSVILPPQSAQSVCDITLCCCPSLPTHTYTPHSFCPSLTAPRPSELRY